jgi:hypothetical protein
MNKKLTIRTEALVLRKETLRRLEPARLAGVDGGAALPTSRPQPTAMTCAQCSAHSSRGG